jgi:Putative lumazine-binding
MKPIDDIILVIRKYFDALYNGDADSFAEVFHPAARLFCGTGGTLLTMDVPQYLDLVRGRASPASRADRRADEIISLEMPTPTTAHVRVKELLLPKYFTDELTLVLVDQRWRVVSKVWHFELEPR